VRHIHRYLIAQKKGETQQNQEEQSNNQAKKALAQAGEVIFFAFPPPAPAPLAASWVTFRLVMFSLLAEESSFIHPNLVHPGKCVMMRRQNPFRRIPVFRIGSYHRRCPMWRGVASCTVSTV